MKKELFYSKESGVASIVIILESFIWKLQFLSYSCLLCIFFLPLLFLNHCSNITLHQAQDSIAVGVECKTVIKRKLAKQILGKEVLVYIKDVQY